MVPAFDLNQQWLDVGTLVKLGGRTPRRKGTTPLWLRSGGFSFEKDLLAFVAGVRFRNCRNECLGVGVLGVLEHGLDIGDLNELPKVEQRHLIADIPNDPKIV